MAVGPVTYRPPSPKQQAATTRNWGIRNLRSLYALAGQLSPERREKVQALIDEELVDRGALPQAKHIETFQERYGK